MNCEDISREDLVYHVKAIILVKLRIMQERIKDHNGRGHKSHMLKHSTEKHDNAAQENFKIIAKNSRNNKWKQKISQSLWIKDLLPTLNAQDKSVPLKLFN